MTMIFKISCQNVCVLNIKYVILQPKSEKLKQIDINNTSITAKRYVRICRNTQNER